MKALKSGENLASQSKTPLWYLFFAGGSAGLVGSWLSFIFEGLKKKRQSNQITEWKIRELYRGLTAFSCSLVPTTALQVSVSSAITYKYGDSERARLYSALFGGFTGSTASTLVENTILRQQLDKSNPQAAFSKLLQEGWRRPWKGISMIGIREMIFGFSYLYGVDAATKYYKNTYETDNTLVPRLLVGAFGSLISHPFDTVGTHMQLKKGKVAPYTAAKEIWSSSGVKGFYKGGLWRIGLFTTAMISINKTVKHAEEIFHQQSFIKR